MYKVDGGQGRRWTRWTQKDKKTGRIRCQQSQTVNPSSEKGAQLAALKKELALLRNPTPSNEDDDEKQRSSMSISIQF